MIPEESGVLSVLFTQHNKQRPKILLKYYEGFIPAEEDKRTVNIQRMVKTTQCQLGLCKNEFKNTYDMDNDIKSR